MEKRYGYVCATDIPPICGFQKWRTQFDVWQEKVYGERSDDKNNSELKSWGLILEPVIAQEFERRTGKTTAKGDFFVACPIQRHACSPDYYIPESSGKEILECKTCHAFAAKEWGNPELESEAEKIPDIYYLQVQWQLRCTGAQICWVAVLIGGNDFRIFKIKRNEKLIKKLIDKANAFWTIYVEQAEIPPPIGTEKENKFLDSTVKQASREVHEADASEALLLLDYQELKGAYERAKEKLEQCKANLKLRLGDRGGIMHDSYTVTWYEQKGRKSVSYKAIAEELGATAEMMNKHTKYSKPTRVFKFEEQ